MEVYVQRTHGTYIEQKGNELIWQFRYPKLISRTQSLRLQPRNDR